MTQLVPTTTSALELPPETTLHTTGLELPDDLRFNDWKRIGETIALHGDSLQWAIGDWLSYGDRYRRDYATAMQEIDGAYQTMRNLAYVASRVDVSRRRDNLSFAHHAEVASLDPDMQDTWLNDALRQGWTRNELRAEIQAWKTGTRHATLVPLVRISIKADQPHLDRWKQAAEHLGVDVDRWMIDTLDQQATLVLDQTDA